MNPIPLIHRAAHLFLIGIIISLVSCSFPTNRTLQRLDYPAPLGTTIEDRTLIVFLRGKSGSHRSFESSGFVDELHKQGLPVDVVAPNTHFGYYMGRSVVDRLKVDIIDPAKSSGYKRIWLVGVSLGSIGSLLYLDSHPDDIDGVCLIAPYLGNSRILDPVEAAGSLQKWQPRNPDAGKDWQQQIWQILKDLQAEGFQTPPVYLAYGTDDRYLRAHKLLSANISEDHIFRVEGGHDFVTFAKAWKALLENGILTPALSPIPDAHRQALAGSREE